MKKTINRINVWLRKAVNRYFRNFNYRLVPFPYDADSKEEQIFRKQYGESYDWIVKNKSNEFIIWKNYRYDAGSHPVDKTDIECQFATQQLSNATGLENILDVGSHRQYIAGLLAHVQVTTIDVRDREPINGNETVVTCDAKRLPLNDQSADAVISLCALEHFGLGRYGDEFDFDADRKAVAEMIRVLRKDGHLILTTNVTPHQREVAFNAHKIYDMEMIREMFAKLHLVREEFYCMRKRAFLPLEQCDNPPNTWTLYLADYRK